MPPLPQRPIAVAVVVFGFSLLALSPSRADGGAEADVIHRLALADYHQAPLSDGTLVVDLMLGDYSSFTFQPAPGNAASTAGTFEILLKKHPSIKEARDSFQRLALGAQISTAAEDIPHTDQAKEFTGSVVVRKAGWVFLIRSSTLSRDALRDIAISLVAALPAHDA